MRFAVARDEADDPWFHPYGAACELEKAKETPSLIGNGTMYKALRRMEASGWFESRYEDPDIAEAARRPRRTFYRITDEGKMALTLAPSVAEAERGSSPAKRKVVTGVRSPRGAPQGI